MICTRREALRAAAATAAGLALANDPVLAALRRGRTLGCDHRDGPQSGADSPQGAQLMRTIPVSGEQIPAVGLGTESSFSRAARIVDEHGKLREVLRRFTELGGRVIDAAPPWDATERVLARLTDEMGTKNEMFWGAKVSIRASGGRDSGMMQFEQSAERLDTIDLEQIQDLLRWEVQLPLLHDLKQEGRIRYVGVTTSSPQQRDVLEVILRTEGLDFVQFDYAVDNRSAERTLIPIARDRGIATLVNSCFSRGRLFQRVGDRPVPEWAHEFGARTWSQFFLKWVLGNDAVTAVIPGTSDPDHLADNMRAGIGRLPNAAERERMARFIDNLPDRGG